MGKVWDITSGDKQSIREGHLHIVKQTPLWRQSGGLAWDWFELAESGPQGDHTMNLLLREKALVPGQGKYIGVNANPAVIEDNRARYGEEVATWIQGRGEGFLNINHSIMRNVGVLIFDGTATIANWKLGPGTLDPLLEFSKAQQKRIGTFLVSITASMRTNVQCGVEEGMNAVSECFRRHLGVEIKPQRIYRSRKRSQKMVMYRVLLRHDRAPQ